MDTPADTSSIDTALTQPLTSSNDGQTATGRTVADLVLGIQFKAACAAAGLKHRGLRFTRLIGAPQLPIHPGPCAGNPGSFQ
ncbi:MAG: hypothetical protein JWO38_4886 [Gemmataceae bacterium]|nr:hypothetical protein [Gemmataceae bacterium]